MGLLTRIDARLRLRSLIEDAVLTAPLPMFRPAFAEAGRSDELARAVRDIQRIGAYLPGALVERATTTAIVAAIDDAVAGRRPDVSTRIEPRTGITHVLKPLLLHPAIATLATDMRFLAVVERYLKRKIYLSDIDMRRVPPMSMGEVDRRAATRSVGYTSSHWHRDIRGRQLKMMIYLSDVTEKDNNFAFMPGSHMGHHRRPRHVEASRFTDEEIADSGATIHECYGAAGTIMIFDTNVIHRLRRKAGAAVRDSLTFYYTPGQSMYALDLDVETLTSLAPAQRALFGGNRPAAHRGGLGNDA